MTTKTTIDRVNVYHDADGHWHYAAWCGSEHDCNGSLPEASTAAEAVAAIAAMWPAAAVQVVEPVTDADDDDSAPGLYDYFTAEHLRDATDEEIAASREAGPEGVILLADDGTILRADDPGADDARRVYVVE